MLELLNIGNSANIPIQQYYAESEQDLEKIPKNAPTGSIVMILEDGKGLTIKMKHSNGTWIKI